MNEYFKTLEIKTIKEQKTFNINKNSSSRKQIVTSGGVLIYKFGNTGMEILIVNSKGCFEDFGDKVDGDDKTIYETISRSAHEESNGILVKSEIEERLMKASSVYIESTKHIVFIIEATNCERQLAQLNFGDFKLNENKQRKIKWIQLSELLEPSIIKHKLNWRLKNSELFSKLSQISNSHKLSVSMFH